jgi:hypothetical protein
MMRVPISGNAASLKLSTLSLCAKAAEEVSQIEICPSAPPLASSLCEGVDRKKKIVHLLLRLPAACVRV